MSLWIFIRGHRLADKKGKVYQPHLVVDSIAPGVYQPEKGHKIHHVDGNKYNNEPNNLVLCEDESYHRLLHTRTRALKECSNANWRKCNICKGYDSLDKLLTRENGKGSIHHWHKACQSEYDRKRYKEQTTPIIPDWIQVLLED